MSRYNSSYSGSQIDSAIAYVLNGYPISNFIATESLNITGSLNVSGDITGSNLRTTNLQSSGSTKITGSLEVTGSINVLGVVNITGSMNLTGNETVFGSIYATSSLSDFYIALLNTGKPTLQLWNRNPAGIAGDAQIMLRTNNAAAIEDSFYITKGAGNDLFPVFKNNTVITNSTGSIIFTDRNNTNRIFEIDTSNNKLNLTGSLEIIGDITGSNFLGSASYAQVAASASNLYNVIQSSIALQMTVGLDTSIFRMLSTRGYVDTRLPFYVGDYSNSGNKTQMYINDTQQSVEITGSLSVSGSIEPTSGSSVILLSPNGTRFKLTVDDSGVVSSSLA